MTVIEVVFPVFAIVALGYYLSRNRTMDVVTISEIVVNVTSPCLVFTSIAKKEMVPSEWLVMGGGAAAVVFGCGALTWLYQRANNVRMRGLYLPTMFMNTGNMGLPFALLAFGETGLEKAIMFFIPVVILHFSLGVYIAKGEGGLREIFRLPLIYAALAGLASSLFHAVPPRFVMTALEMLADVAIPLMILNLGIQLRLLKVSKLRHAVAGVLIRMLGGLALAYAFVAIFGIGGVSRNVIFLDAIMPPAVFNVIFAQKYNADADVVASTIVLGTLFSVALTPAYLAFVT